MSDNLFLGCRLLKSVVVPEGVTGIGEMAFSYCDALESVYIPESAVYFGEMVFAHSRALKSLVFADPRGWSTAGENIPEHILSDPEQAALYAKESVYEWIKQ